ncbi:PRC-barrel domain-containing protein [Roseibium aggregatum]|uniref:PRC-barrel domain-containing protein n=1 Tax=Roseibium aggregatum TaxID=187304 RepID=A0A926P1I4_9HYPH|nr:PRC-barrel domain-containing protein [Roseibium aggregatum]MBD1549554.1 PRC-barrel domain-containing protein [Roseibium aggregatum]
MIRTLLTTTALVAALTTGAFAAETMTKSESQMGKDEAGVSVFTETPSAKPMESINGYFAADHSQVLATTLIGKMLYNGTGENAETIGDVNDIVLSPNGEAEAVVVGVGGFLGIGEKDVAVDFDRVSWTERDGTRWLTTNATKEELKNAPAFDRSMFEVEDNTAKLDINTVTDDIKEMAAESKKTDEGQAMTQAKVANADDLIGAPVFGVQDEELGEVSDVIVSDNGMIKSYIIDVGGFLGIGEKPVALDAEKLDIRKNADGELRIYTDFTSKQLEAMPEYSGQADHS